MCEYCDKDIQVVIVLDNGDLYEVCLDCLINTIKEKATTDNPVHSIEEVTA